MSINIHQLHVHVLIVTIILVALAFCIIMDTGGGVAVKGMQFVYNHTKHVKRCLIIEILLINNE